MTIHIVTDSTCDLPADIVHKLGVTVLPLNIHIGEFLSIKPLLHMNMGKSSVERVRTQKRATGKLMTWLEQYAPFERLAVLHAGIQQKAEALRESVRAYWPGNDVPVLQITPVLGAHLGVGALGFACISKK
jgi:fatty acid-binding protein DegV